MEEIFSAILSDLPNIKNDVLSVITTLILIFVVITGYYILAGVLLRGSSDKDKEDKDDN